MKTSKTQVTYEILDDMVRKYAIAKMITDYPTEFEEAKTIVRNQLLKSYEII